MFPVTDYCTAVIWFTLIPPSPTQVRVGWNFHNEIGWLVNMGKEKNDSLINYCHTQTCCQNLLIGPEWHDFASIPPPTHPPDRLDFFRTRIFFGTKILNPTHPQPKPNFNPTQPQPNPNQTYSQTRVWHCKPSLFSFFVEAKLAIVFDLFLLSPT